MMNNIKNVFFSPLEQFEILPLFSLYLGGLDFSITNEAVILLIIFFVLVVLKSSMVNQSDLTFYIVPHRWQIILEGIYKVVLSMVVDNIGLNRGQHFFPLVFAVFFYVLGQETYKNVLASSECFACINYEAMLKDPQSKGCTLANYELRQGDRWIGIKYRQRN